MKADLSCLAPAKINLFLHVLGRRADGYHELQTLFQFVDLTDQLDFHLRQDAQLNVHCADLAIAPEQNLVLRAARLLQQRCGRTVPGVDITLTKRIPVGGGLGGGSSDAATVLLALNQLWALGWSRDQLSELGLLLGADVPVFVQGHAAWAEGVGELLTAVDPAEGWLLIVQPEVPVSTAQVFESIDLTGCSSKMTIPCFFSGGCSGNNDCEPVVRQLFPVVGQLLDWLQQYGQARLSGTGSCCYLFFSDHAQAAAVARRVPAPWRGYVVQSSNVHPMGDNS